MALKIKCNYKKTSNLRYPYQVRTQFLCFNFSNKRDAQRFCNSRTKDYNNLYISVVDTYSDALLLVVANSYKDLHLSRAVEQIQYFIQHADYNADAVRFERVCAAAISSLIFIYKNSVNCKRLQKQWERVFETKFTNICKPFCEGSVLITRVR